MYYRINHIVIIGLDYCRLQNSPVEIEPPSPGCTEVLCHAWLSNTEKVDVCTGSIGNRVTGHFWILTHYHHDKAIYWLCIHIETSSNAKVPNTKIPIVEML